MGSYAKGEQTRAALVAAARELFFERGYDATKLDDIAAAADANPGLIHYHFKTKANIALEVYDELLMGLVAAAERLAEGEGILMRRALELRVFWAAIECDRRLATFLAQISALRIPQLMPHEVWDAYAAEMSEASGLDASPSELALINTCSIATEGEIILAFAQDAEGLSADACCEMDLRVYLRLFSVPARQIDELSKRSRELLDGIEAHMVAPFQVEFTRA